MVRNEDPGRPRAPKKAAIVARNQGNITFLEPSLRQHGEAAPGSHQANVPGRAQLERPDESDGTYCRGSMAAYSVREGCRAVSVWGLCWSYGRLSLLAFLHTARSWPATLRC